MSLRTCRTRPFFSCLATFLQVPTPAFHAQYFELGGPAQLIQESLRFVSRKHSSVLCLLHKVLMFLTRSHQLGGECNGFCHYLLFKLSRSVDSRFVPKAFLAMSSAFWSNVRSSRSVHLGFLPLGVSPSDHARPVHTQGSPPLAPQHLNTDNLDIITANSA